ncbi:MAG: hypothetical protein QN649_09155 [Nitrososphaeraceae archaeon]|nr:hypothetical protein [Nitrososphaeraceae archaeon]
MTTPNVYEEMTGQGTNCERNLDNGNPVEGAHSFIPVIYFADKSNYLDYLPMVEHMFKSFQLKSTKPVIQED